MMLIEHEARVGLPRMWEHPRRTRTRRGGVVQARLRLVGHDYRPRLVLPSAGNLPRLEPVPSGTILDAMLGRVLRQLHKQYDTI